MSLRDKPRWFYILPKQATAVVTSNDAIADKRTCRFRAKVDCLKVRHPSSYRLACRLGSGLLREMEHPKKSILLGDKEMAEDWKPGSNVLGISRISIACQTTLQKAQ